MELTLPKEQEAGAGNSPRLSEEWKIFSPALDGARFHTARPVRQLQACNTLQKMALCRADARLSAVTQIALERPQLLQRAFEADLARPQCRRQSRLGHHRAMPAPAVQFKQVLLARFGRIAQTAHDDPAADAGLPQAQGFGHPRIDCFIHPLRALRTRPLHQMFALAQLVAAPAPSLRLRLIHPPSRLTTQFIEQFRRYPLPGIAVGPVVQSAWLLALRYPRAHAARHRILTSFDPRSSLDPRTSPA